MTLDNLTDLAETTAMEICVTTNHDTCRMPQLARASGSRLAYACFRTRRLGMLWQSQLQH